MPRQVDQDKLDALIANDEKCRKESREARAALEEAQKAIGPATSRLLKAQRDLDASEAARRNFLAGT